MANAFVVSRIKENVKNMKTAFSIREEADKYIARQRASVTTALDDAIRDAAAAKTDAERIEKANLLLRAIKQYLGDANYVVDGFVLDQDVPEVLP